MLFLMQLALTELEELREQSIIPGALTKIF